MRILVLSLVASLTLTACGYTPLPSGPSVTRMAKTPGVEVPTDGYETYVTDHNGYTRIRRSDGKTDDAAVLKQFEDSDPASPAGFRSLVLTQKADMQKRVMTEVIIEQPTKDTIARVLRLTTDVEAFTPKAVEEAAGKVIQMSGTDYSLVRLGDGDYTYANQSDGGSLYMVLNFKAKTATIRIMNRQLYFHTPDSAPMDKRVVDLLGANLPFDPQTGEFGGDITGEVTELYVRLGTEVIPVTGTLLGQVGGPSLDKLVAGGVFQASGSKMVMGKQTAVQVEGVFVATPAPASKE